jgi:hypothetical protein
LRIFSPDLSHIFPILKIGFKYDSNKRLYLRMAFIVPVIGSTNFDRTGIQPWSMDFHHYKKPIPLHESGIDSKGDDIWRDITPNLAIGG